MISHFSFLFSNIFPMEMIANLAKQTQKKKKKKKIFIKEKHLFFLFKNYT